MPPSPIVLERPPTSTLRVVLEPTQNIFESLMLLSKHHDDLSGTSEWIQKTRAAMKKKEMDRHNLVMIGFFFAILPQDGNISFPAYLEQLGNMDPIALRARLLDSYESPEWFHGADDKVNWKIVLASSTNYINFLHTRFDEEHVDEKLEAKAYEYVINPPAMKELIVEHMNWVWQNHMEPEWKRVQPMLEESVKAFQSSNLSDMKRIDAARFITGKELDEVRWADVNKLENAKTVSFIPNAHIGPYLHGVINKENLSIIFGARLPEGSAIRIPELDRAEIVTRLSAIADDTRLQILKMIAESEETRTQDIMDRINMSQPSVSRYLTQLTATGYLLERRVNGAKAYTLNRERIEKTLKAVSAFLLG